LDTLHVDKARISKTGNNFMHLDRLRALICGTLVVGSTFAAVASASAETPYDGLWNVTIVTKTGSCEPTARYPVTVSDGHVTGPSPDVTGKVGREGAVRVSIGPAFANGQLTGNTGSGKWNGASGGVPCSGRWEASRQ
jgi:hypothetical protein